MKMQRFLIAFLLVTGIYLPTSSNSIISTKLAMVNNIILLVVLIIMHLHKRKINRVQFFLVMGICISLLVGTLITPFVDIKYGNTFLYLLLCLMFFLDLKDIKLTKYVHRLFTVINFINIFICLGIVIKNEKVLEFITQHYSAFYDDLLLYMLSSHKPVLTFGSHSIAGFFLYIFFFLNLQSYKATDKILNLIFSISYMSFLIFLTSNTAFLYFGIALIQLVSYLFAHKRSLLYCLVMMGLIMYWINIDSVNMYVQSAYFKLQEVSSSTSNGILGRYGGSGDLAADINYIENNPFRPIGFGYSQDLFYGDSGFVEFMLRGSLVLLFCIYFALFRFLKVNLHSKKTAITIFCLILLFEFGYSGLIYFRTLYLLPFVVVYLNAIEETKKEQINAKKINAKKKIKIKWAA